MSDKLGYGDVIKAGRESKGWRQQDLAERLDRIGRRSTPPFTVSASTVSNWEREITRPDIEIGNVLVRALTLPEDEFWAAMGVELTMPADAQVPRPLREMILAMNPERRAALYVFLGGGDPRDLDGRRQS